MNIKDKLIASITSSMIADDDNFARVTSNLRAVDETYKSWLASALQNAWSKELRAMPTDTIEDKRAVASWTNRELRHFGLAVKCPNTGLPSRVDAYLNTQRTQNGIFRFEIVDEETHKRTSRCYRDALKDIEIIPDSIERRYLAESMEKNRPPLSR